MATALATAAPQHWHDSPEARVILRGLTPAHVSIRTITPIVGPRYQSWTAGETDELLDEMRRAYIVAGYGKSFAECVNDDERRAYLEFDATHENVDEVLRGLFGTPGRWGRPSDLLIDCDRGAGATSAWRRECGR